MPTQTKKQRSQAAQKAARTRKRNQRQEEAQAARVTNDAGEATAPLPSGPNPKVDRKHTRRTTRGPRKDDSAGGGFVADAEPTDEQKAAEKGSGKKKDKDDRNPRDARSGYTDRVLPNRAAGEVEISRRADPHRNNVRHDIVSTGSTAKPLPVNAPKRTKKVEVDLPGYAGATVFVVEGLEATDGRAPFTAPVAKAKVTQSGTAKLELPTGGGHYTAFAEVERRRLDQKGTEKRWERQQFVVS